MKDVLCIYAQRADNDEVWEEANALESCYTGNTIAIIENDDGSISYDFSGCGRIISTACLNGFFRTIGVQMGNSRTRDYCLHRSSLN